MDIELALDARAVIGESPTWSIAEQALYWIDIKAPALHRFDPKARTTRSWPTPTEIGGFALIAGRPAALVALRTGLFSLDLRTGALRKEADAPFDPKVHRFNEGACDSEGRFWIGTMFDPVGDYKGPAQRAGLNSFRPGQSLRSEPDAAELHNGMAWSPDEKNFYLSHSQCGKIYAFGFDRQTGKLGKRRVFATIPRDLGLPDGAAVDVEGGYWCAIHGGWRLHRYAPSGALDREIELPVSQPTMCAFGGPDLQTIYVTSAADKLSQEQLRREPSAGGIFSFRSAVRGLPRNCLTF